MILALPDRSGLPDDIAYLRTAYPQSGWHAHANFGQLADFWLRVHGTLRHHGTELGRITHSFREGQLDPASFQRSFVPKINQFLQHLTGHHQIEDQAYFPKFRSLDPRMVVGFELLEADHHLIHDALLASADSARAMLAALARPGDASRFAADAYSDAADILRNLLVRHLADEEDLVIPAMLEHGERSLA